MTEPAKVPEPAYCPHCGNELPLKGLLHALTRAIIENMLEVLSEPDPTDQPDPAAKADVKPDPRQDPRSAGLF